MIVFAISASDIALVALILVAMIAVAGTALRVYHVRRNCAHKSGTYETRACEAICCKCGKNLGFIGRHRP